MVKVARETNVRSMGNMNVINNMVDLYTDRALVQASVQATYGKLLTGINYHNIMCRMRYGEFLTCKPYSTGRALVYLVLIIITMATWVSW